MPSKESFPYAVPSTGVFIGNSPKGRGMDAARCRWGRSPIWQPSMKTPERRKQAASGGFFFGYFLLAAQKKVSRLRVREPDLNKIVAIATHQNILRLRNIIC